MKKLVGVLCALGMIGILVGCGKTEDKTFDNEFIDSLEQGLSDRWDYLDRNPSEEDGFKVGVEKELEAIESYKDKKFLNDKLKEKAISYINELKDGKEVAENQRSTSFFEKWDKHQKRRDQLIVEINELSELKVPTKHKKTLDSILSSGKEVKEDTKLKEQLDNIAADVKFEKNLMNIQLIIQRLSKIQQMSRLLTLDFLSIY